MSDLIKCIYKTFYLMSVFKLARKSCMIIKYLSILYRQILKNYNNKHFHFFQEIERISTHELIYFKIKIHLNVYMSNEPSKVTKQVFFQNYSRESERSSSQMKIVERSFEITNYSLSSRRKSDECNVTYRLQQAYQYMLPITPTNTTLAPHTLSVFIHFFIFHLLPITLSYKAANEIYPLHHSQYSIPFSHTFANLGPL